MFQYPANIFEAVRKERDDFLNNSIEIVPGYMFNQYETIKKIHLYYNSQYVDGAYEEVNGVRRKKIFANITKWRAEVWTKQLDFDVKDFVLISNNPDTEMNVMTLEKELKAWLKRNKMGQLLNEITRRLPIYGSVVLEKVKGGAELVDLRYLMTDQSVECLDDSPYVIKKMLMLPKELRKMKGAWDSAACDEAIEKYCSYTSTSYLNGPEVLQQSGSTYAPVYVRYGEVPSEWLEDDTTGFNPSDYDGDDLVMAKFVVCGIDNLKEGDNGTLFYEPGLVLYKEKIKELPFKEVHASKTEGRWLGIGVVEELFEPQRVYNRVKNLEDRALELASTVVFQATEATAVQNITTDAQNGDIFISKGAINRLDTTQHSVGELSKVAEDYENLANRQTFSSDYLSGETPPASATATAVMNQVQQAGSVFDYKRENIGLFLEDFIKTLVFPEIKKEINAAHKFRFVGSADDMSKIRKKLAMSSYYNAVSKLPPETVTEITPEIKQMMLAAYEQEFAKVGNKLWLDVEENFYDNLDYEMDLALTNESRNIQTQLQNTQVVLGMVSQNPAILQNPVLKRLFFKMLSLIGMSISELDILEDEQMDQQAQMAASPSAQFPQQTPPQGIDQQQAPAQV